jgi:hypothetical protein
MQIRCRWIQPTDPTHGLTDTVDQVYVEMLSKRNSSNSAAVDVALLAVEGGQHFFFIRNVSQTNPPTQINVVLNLVEELARRMRANQKQ